MKLMYLVHQFYPMHYTGTEKFIFKLAHMQQLAGHRVKVVTYSFYEPGFYDREFGNILYREFIYGQVEVLAFRHREIPDAIHSALKIPDCREFALHILTEYSPDIVHAGHIMRVSEFIHAAKSLRIPYIMTLTDYWMFCHKGIMLTDALSLCPGCEQGHACASCAGLTPEQKTERYSYATKILIEAQCVVSPSRFLADMYEREFPGLRLQIVQHGIDFETIIRQQRVYTGGGSLVFGFCGTLAWHKGAHVAVQSARLVPGGGFRLLIYGDGEDAYINKLREISDAKISFQCAYNEADIGQVFSELDVLIVPSLWYENYPLALYEALASEIPVIASGIGGMAERIRNDFNGFTFPPGDSGALADIMKRIMDNPASLNRLKKNLRQNPLPAVEQEAWRYSDIYSRQFKET